LRSSRWLLLAALLSTSAARAAVVLVPSIADDDPIEATRARADLLKVVGRIPGVVIAPLSKFRKLALAADLNPLELSSAKAAVQLGKTTNLTQILAGAVEEQNGRRVLRLRLFDRAGSLLYRGTLDLGERVLAPEETQLVAERLTTALGLEAGRPGGSDEAGRPAGSDEIGPAPSRVLIPHQPERAAPVEAAVSALSPGEPLAPARPLLVEPAEEAAPTLTMQEQLPMTSLSNRFEDPGFQIELGVQGSLLNTGIVDDTLNGSCGAGSSGCIGGLASSLYPGVVGRLQSFPFHDRLDALAGLGLVATGSFATLKIEGSAAGETGSATDVRIGADLVYRLRLGFLSGDAAIFSPSLGVRAGLAMSRFDPQSGVTQLSALDRIGARFGTELLEPLGHSVRLVLGGDLITSPTPGSAVAETLASQSTASDGFDVSCELQGHFARPNASGLTASLRMAYGQFNDCFEQVAGAGCSYSGSQTTVDFDAMVGWAFY
jgi:hypothetical protein